jgi:lipopolysaccharide export system protein LptA
MEIEQSSKKASFLGNAKVIQGDSWIFADKIVVYFNENNQTKKYNAVGNVKFELKKDKAHYKGYAKEIIYKPLDKLYVIKGNAKINDIINKRVINGDSIVLDMQTGNAKVKGSSKKPIKVIFEMESKK